MQLSLKEYFYGVMTQGVAVLAIQEGAWSNLPGKDGGPWDAYRHILLAAELTRRYDETSARSILYLHELSGDRTLVNGEKAADGARRVA